MTTQRMIVSVKLFGKRYYGSYHLQNDRLHVESVGLGTISADADILDGQLDASAQKFAKLLLMELVKENSTGTAWRMPVLEDTGSTTQCSF